MLRSRLVSLKKLPFVVAALTLALAMGVGVQAQDGIGGTLTNLGFGLGDEIATECVAHFQELYPDVELQFTVGIITEPAMLNSIGTAETLLGAWDFRPLTADDEASGLLFGCHVIPNTTYWMGSLSASGGSIEWMRHLLGERPLTYAELQTLIEPITAPTGILYYPYLSGSDQSITDQGAFIGLQHRHGRGDLMKAVIEGITYEIEQIRAIVGANLGITADIITVAGGGTRNQAWMQIKADVSGVPQQIYPSAEATVLGAALVAGLGTGVYQSPADAVTAVNVADSIQTRFEPRAEHHARYRELFAEYQRLLPALRDFYR